MENRMGLNKKPVYELPDDVLVGDYRKGIKTPDFEPDLCINTWGSGTGKIYNKYETTRQIWVKTNNEELKECIKNIDFKKHMMSTNGLYTLSLWKFKKIVLEEFFR